MWWTIIISDLNNEEIVGTYYGKEFQKKQIKKNVLKVLKRKDNKLYVKILLTIGSI